MEKSATQIADDVLGSPGNLEVLRIHEFTDDESAHDDEQVEALYKSFRTTFASACAELSDRFGPPLHVGIGDHKLIPLNGVFDYAIWTIEDQLLYIAAAHEDRGVPILLMIGSEVL